MSAIIIFHHIKRIWHILVNYQMNADYGCNSAWKSVICCDPDAVDYK